MINVQITTPVLPKKATEKKLIACIEKIITDPHCKIQFFESGIDFYGQNKFDVMVLDEDRSEKNDIRNEVMTAIFSTLYNN